MKTGNSRLIFLTLWLLLAAGLSACGGGGGGGGTPGDNTGGSTSEDRDGDGLSNTEETTGWMIVVDSNGFGLQADASLLEQRSVTSDPDLADTDGDGLTDQQEYVLRSDPRRADTDGDGLPDWDEEMRWNTDVTGVDSDGDSFDPDGTRSPDSSFFDGAEVTSGTSPSQADTDGDGLSDFDEFEQSRDPVIAEIARADIAVSSDITIIMNVEYSETTGQSTEYGSTFGASNTSTQSRSDSESTAITQAASSGGEGFFDDLEFSPEGAIKFFGGKLLELGRSTACEWGDSGQVDVVGLIQFDPENLPVDVPVLTDHIEQQASIARNIFNPVADSFGLCDAPTPETTNTTTTTLTSESSHTAYEEYSRYVTDSEEKTETYSDGTVSLSVRVTNLGAQTFTLSNPELTMMQWQSNPSADGSPGSGSFRTFATLTVADGASNSFVIAPGASTQIQLQNNDVNPEFIKAFLARPQAIFFSPANFTYTDADGVDFRYIHEDNFNRTANVVIDDGQTAVQRFQVATNVDRTESGDFAGLRVGTLFSDILADEGVSYSVSDVSRNKDGSSVTVNELESINGHGSVAPQTLPDPYSGNGLIGDPQRRWVVYMSDSEVNTTTTDFNNLLLNPDDELRLVYIRDDDGDGLFKREEDLYGSSDNPNDGNATDFDGDGLSDAYEVKTGWTISIDYSDNGGNAQNFRYRVTSSPVIADADEDGLDDLEEKNLGTDPFNSDTDGDQVADGCEVYPLNPDFSDTNGASLPLCNYAYAYLVGVSGGTQLYQVDAGDGSLESIGSAGGGGDALAIDPQSRYAYSVNGSSSPVLRAYTLDKGAGELSALPDIYQYDSNFSGLEDWSSVAVDPGGELLFATDTGPDRDGTYSFRISDGSDPGETAGQVIKLYFDNSDVQYSPTKVKVHPDGDLIYIGRNGSTMGVASVDRDPASPTYGEFSEVPGSPFDMTYAVRDYEFSPDGRFLYVANWSSGVAPSLRIFEITPDGSERGALTQIDNFNLPGEVKSLVISADGRYLFGSDIDNDQILSWSIDSDSGLLTAVDRLPATPSVHDGYLTANQPNELAIHPSGRALYIGSSDGTFVQSVDTDTGVVSELDPMTDTPVNTGNPDQILIHRIN